MASIPNAVQVAESRARRMLEIKGQMKLLDEEQTQMKEMARVFQEFNNTITKKYS
jgi:uncharacterized membrane protein